MCRNKPHTTVNVLVFSLAGLDIIISVQSRKQEANYIHLLSWSMPHLRWGDFQQRSEFFKRDVVVEFTSRQEVVFNHSSVQDAGPCNRRWRVNLPKLFSLRKKDVTRTYLSHVTSSCLQAST